VMASRHDVSSSVARVQCMTSPACGYWLICAAAVFLCKTIVTTMVWLPHSNVCGTGINSAWRRTCSCVNWKDASVFIFSYHILLMYACCVL
jgi:hypothetical protein